MIEWYNGHNMHVATNKFRRMIHFLSSESLSLRNFQKIKYWLILWSWYAYGHGKFQKQDKHSEDFIQEVYLFPKFSKNSMICSTFCFEIFFFYRQWRILRKLEFCGNVCLQVVVDCLFDGFLWFVVVCFFSLASSDAAWLEFVRRRRAGCAHRTGKQPAKCSVLRV